MKTGIKTAVIFTTLLAGTLITDAHPQGRGQQQKRSCQNAPLFQQQGCPVCGNPHFRPQHLRRNQQAPHPQMRKGSKRCTGSSPQQREQIKQRKQQAILNLFDTNRDGQLSENERQSVRQALQGRLDGTAKRQQEPLVEE